MTKKFISAGAGSGKTYTITTDVAKMVKDHLLNPDQVIMTTFTKAAAQELREKAKKELAKLGLHREAQQMEHALIGTVHSVANTFLTKYWYLLGIMPDAAAMEESELQMYRDHSLRGLLNNDDRAFLYRFTETYNIIHQNDGKSGPNYEFWKKDLCSVLDYIQWYSISDEQLKKAVSQLSGGQQQRVAIARALVTGPAIICMDEPLSNLDAKLRVQLRNELKKMQKEFGITTIYVTHDQEDRRPSSSATSSATSTA